MAVFSVGNGDVIDEVSMYQLGRYINSNEDIWRILDFNIHERYPPVVHLGVHLENGQRVYFTEGNARDKADVAPATTLTAYFALCQKDYFAEGLFYHEVPTYYTWSPSQKESCRTKIGSNIDGTPDLKISDVLGRVYTVHPNSGECHYLRFLLHKERGPTSFETLRTVDGRECVTFKEACLALGLLKSDKHWDTTLAEACAVSYSRQLRDLFAVILSTYAPSDPQSLWDKYEEFMCEDVVHQLRVLHPDATSTCNSDVFNEGLKLLEDKCVNMNGKTLVQLGLPEPIRRGPSITNREIWRERNYNIDEQGDYVASHGPLLLPAQ